MICRDCGSPFNDPTWPYQRCHRCHIEWEQLVGRSLVEPTPDPGYCGLDPIVTGPEDPYFIDGDCPDHDADFDELKAATEYEAGSITNTFLQWTRDTTLTAVRGAWAVLGFPFYLIIGGIGGMIRGNQLARPKVKQDPPGGETF